MPARADNPRNLLTSLILVFPLLCVYQVGVLFTLPMLNGADFVTTLLFQTFHLTIRGYLFFLTVVVATFVGALALLRRKQRFNSRIVLPMLLESTIYALTMGSLIVLVMTKFLGFPPSLDWSVGGLWLPELIAGYGDPLRVPMALPGLQEQGLVTRLVMSIGAGVYEETVFRLGLLGGLVAVFEKLLGLGRWVAIAAAFVLSAIAFSAVHHIPPYGDPFSMGIFTFRLLAGVFFGLLFWLRGFAVAVYTHALYDIYVLLIR